MFLGNSVVGRSMFCPVPKNLAALLTLHSAVKESQPGLHGTESPGLARPKAPGFALTGSPVLRSARLLLPEMAPLRHRPLQV